MDDKTLASVCKQVYQKYPEVQGVRPKVKAQPGESTLLVFQAKAQTASGQTLPRTVRVTVSAAGKITKMSTSK
jgi:hypothetical protein